VPMRLAVAAASTIVVAIMRAGGRRCQRVPPLSKPSRSKAAAAAILAYRTSAQEHPLHHTDLHDSTVNARGKAHDSEATPRRCRRASKS
jgi:hypothetical protein